MASPRRVPSSAVPSTPVVSRRVVLLGGVGLVGGAGLAATVAVPTSSAAPPAPGQYVVGTTPVALVQPGDSLLGRATPAADADTKGMFGPQVAWPLVPVHAALLANGHVVSYGSPLGTAQQGGLSYDDWNPALGTVTGAHGQTPSMGYDSFCNSIQILPDGRALMVGGNSTGSMSTSTMLYDPVTRAETMGAGLTKQRWYATTLRLVDDRMLVLGGANYYNTGAYQNPSDTSGVGVTPEIGTGTGAWTPLSGATSTTAFGAQNNRWWYPRAFNAPDGTVVGVSADQLWRLDPAGAGSVTPLGTLPASLGVSGAAVLYAPGRLLLAGGGQDANYDTVTATNAATTVDLSTTRPTVKAVAPMALRRNWLNLTVLPTGEVLANGGTVVGTNAGADNSSYATELWNPATQTWRTGASAQRIRTYHSTSLLLPSGAVLTGGGGIPGPEDNLNAELYYPPSLFARTTAGVTWASRPTITSLAGSLTWGGRVTLGLGDTRQISSVSLISAARVTHSVDTDQRRIPLSFTQNGAAVTATVPMAKGTVPPGTYLLSVVDGKGVPSPSQLVTLRTGAAGQVTVLEADRSAGQTGATGTSVPGVVPLTVGSSVSLEAVDYPGYRVRHQNYVARLDPIGGTATALERFDSAFVVRSGLSSAAAAVSFEAAGYPGWFLSVENGRTFLRQGDGSTAFAARSTFTPQTGLTGQNTSFALTADPRTVLRHQNFLVLAQTSDGTDQFRQDATFSVRGALGPPPGTATLRNVNSGLALATLGGGTAQGTAVVQAVAGAAGTRWTLRDAGDGQYQLVDTTSGLLLGITGMSLADGATALVWGDNGTADHLWRLVPRAAHHLLVNVNSGKVLGVDRMSTAAGAQVLQWNDNGTADHFWDVLP